MTRKCVLCKGTNYRNVYSFFSAPKDDEIRKKWQAAIGIENYFVTDETYVCSKHFDKNDIVTHWVSGVPPQVIKIKYKKCRLRLGAIPCKYLRDDLHTNKIESSGAHEMNRNSFAIYNKKEDEHISEPEKENFLASEAETTLMQIQENLSSNGKIIHEDSLNNQAYVFAQITANEQDDRTIEMDASSPEMHTDLMTINFVKEELHIIDKIIQMENKESNMKENAFHLECAQKEQLQKELDDCTKNNEIEHIAIENTNLHSGLFDNEKLDPLNLDTPGLIMYDEPKKNELLFEDLLEISSDIILPEGWSCNVVSKGYATTITYLYMNVTKSGMPYIEKQVFLRADMILHCAAANQELSPLNHKLIREGKHIKIETLLDIEELIDEFHQRVVCKGVERCYEIDDPEVMRSDGIKWRHVSCPLLITSKSLRCNKCFKLFQTARVSKFSFSRNSISTLRDESERPLARRVKRSILNTRRKPIVNTNSIQSLQS